jgi:hypothetical protein
MKKRPTDLNALFLLKVLSNGDTFYPLVVFSSVGQFFLNLKLLRWDNWLGKQGTLAFGGVFP